MIVMDASAVVELLLGGSRGSLVVDELEAHEGETHEPSLLDVEVTQVLRRLVGASVITAARGRASVEILQDLGLFRHPARLLLPRVWSLREKLTAYDAVYVALAEALGCPLVTFDGRLARAPGLGTDVRMLSG